MLFGPKLIKICDKSIIIHYKFQFNKFLKISDNYTISADERCIFLSLCPLIAYHPIGYSSGF